MLSDTQAAVAPSAERRFDPWLGGGLLLTLAWWLITFFPVGRAHFRRHDFLDSLFTNYFLRARTDGWFWNFDARVPALDGLPLNSLALSDLSVPLALYEVFPPFTALVVIMGLLSLGGFVGMYLLLRDWVLHGLPRAAMLAAVVALSFVFLIHMPSRLGNILLLPLLLVAMANLWQRRHVLASAAIVVCFPLFWAFIYGGYIIFAAVVATAFVGWVRKAPGRRALLAAGAAFSAVALVAEARLIYTILIWDFESFRGTGETPALEVLSHWAMLIKKHALFDANSHHYQGQWPVLVLLVGAVLMMSVLALVYQRIRYGVGVGVGADDASAAAEGIFPDAAQRALRRLLLALGATLLVSIVWATAIYLYPLYSEAFPYRLDRLDALSPVLWRIDAALALAVLAAFGATVVRRFVLPVAALGVFLFALQHQMFEIKSGIAAAAGLPSHASLRLVPAALMGKPVPAAVLEMYETDGYPALEDQMQVEAFERIKAVLDPLGPRGSYRVLMVGTGAQALLYHGFHPLNGYFYHHGRAYTEDLLRIFAPEAAKYEADGLPRPILMKRIVTPVAPQSVSAEGFDLDFDVCLFKQAGGRVVMSTQPLVSAPRLGLEKVVEVPAIPLQWPVREGMVRRDRLYVYVVDEMAPDWTHCRFGDATLDHRLSVGSTGETPGPGTPTATTMTSDQK